MLETVLILLLFVLVVFSAILGIWQMFVYIGMSWARRDNSKGYTGIENAEAVFREQGDQIEVKKAFWSATYVDYNKHSKRLKLGLIDSRRKSLWTVATTGRQAYSAHIIEKANQGEKPPISIFWFKLQTFWFGMLMSFLFYGLVMWSLFMWSNAMVETETLINPSLFLFLIVLFSFPILTATATFKTSKVMLQNVDNIFGNIYSPEEVEKIRKLWKIEYIKAIMDLIAMLLYLIIMILKLASSEGEGRGRGRSARNRRR